MDNILKIPNITETSLNRLISNLDKESYHTFIEVFTEELQEIIKALESILNSKNIDSNTGVWLDFIGSILGVERLGRSDEQYRVAIRLKILLNNSSGTTQEVQDIVKNFTSSTHTLIGKFPSSLSGTLYLNGKQNNSSSLYDLVYNIIPLESYLTICSDFNNNSLFLSWEKQVSTPEQFQTTKDGITYENFQTLNSLGNAEDFYTNDSLNTLYTYWEDKSKLYWEDQNKSGSIFQTTEQGVTYENFQVISLKGVLEDFYTFTFTGVDKSKPLCWEITSKSKYINPLYDAIDKIWDYSNYVLPKDLKIKG